MSETTQLRPILSFGEACDRGKVREENQDSVRHVSTPMGELVLVADGIGGYRGAAPLPVSSSRASRPGSRYRLLVSLLPESSLKLPHSPI